MKISKKIAVKFWENYSFFTENDKKMAKSKTIGQFFGMG